MLSSSQQKCCLAFVLLSAILGTRLAASAQSSFNPSILQDSRDLPHTDGTFGFLYRTEDGIAHAAKGDSNGVVHGRFSYTDPTGLKVNYNYNAGSRVTPGYDYDGQSGPRQYENPPPAEPQYKNPAPAPQYKNPAPAPQYKEYREPQYREPEYRQPEYRQPEHREQEFRAPVYRTPVYRPRPQPRPQSVYSELPKYAETASHRRFSAQYRQDDLGGNYVQQRRSRPIARHNEVYDDY